MSWKDKERSGAKLPDSDPRQSKKCPEFSDLVRRDNLKFSSFPRRTGDSAKGKSLSKADEGQAMPRMWDPGDSTCPTYADMLKNLEKAKSKTHAKSSLDFTEPIVSHFQSPVATPKMKSRQWNPKEVLSNSLPRFKRSSKAAEKAKDAKSQTLPRLGKAKRPKKKADNSTVWTKLGEIDPTESDDTTSSSSMSCKDYIRGWIYEKPSDKTQKKTSRPSKTVPDRSDMREFKDSMKGSKKRKAGDKDSKDTSYHYHHGVAKGVIAQYLDEMDGNDFEFVEFNAELALMDQTEREVTERDQGQGQLLDLSSSMSDVRAPLPGQGEKSPSGIKSKVE